MVTYPSDWKTNKIIDVADIFDNLRIPVTKNQRKPGNTPYYGANGIQDYVSGYTHDGEFVLIAEDGANDFQNYSVTYAYIAFKRESALRSQYTGDRPNADPRKWEMASKVLYKTKQPEMLRALVGDEITRDFVRFCNQQVVTLQDVLDDNYNEYDLEMNTDEKWATVVGLSYVDDKNIEKVRSFVLKFEPELISIFDSLWTHGSEKRIEKIAEQRLAMQTEYNPEGGMKR